MTKVKTHISEGTYFDTPEHSARPFALVLSVFLSLSSHFFTIHISETEFSQLLHFSVFWGQRKTRSLLVFLFCFYSFLWSGRCPSFLVLSTALSLFSEKSRPAITWISGWNWTNHTRMMPYFFILCNIYWLHNELNQKGCLLPVYQKCLWTVKFYLGPPPARKKPVSRPEMILISHCVEQRKLWWWCCCSCL